MKWFNILKLTPKEKEQVTRFGEEDAAYMRHAKETDSRAEREIKRKDMGLSSGTFMGRGTPRSKRSHRRESKDEPTTPRKETRQATKRRLLGAAKKLGTMPKGFRGQ